MPMADAYRSRGSATKQMIVLTIPMKARRNAKVSHAQNYVKYTSNNTYNGNDVGAVRTIERKFAQLFDASNSHMNRNANIILHNKY